MSIAWARAHRSRHKVAPWAYGPIVLFSAIAATGAGLHVVRYAYDLEHPIAVQTAVLAFACPVLLFMVTRYLLHTWPVSAAPRITTVHLVSLLLPIGSSHPPTPSQRKAKQ